MCLTWVENLSFGSGKKFHGTGGQWTLMDNGRWRKGIPYDSYVRTHRQVSLDLDFGLWRLDSELT